MSRWGGPAGEWVGGLESEWVGAWMDERTDGLKEGKNERTNQPIN